MAGRRTTETARAPGLVGDGATRAGDVGVFRDRGEISACRGPVQPALSIGFSFLFCGEAIKGESMAN